jgi:hypothetical protein
MRLTERSMLTIATDVRTAEIQAATDERRRREEARDERRAARSDGVRAPWPGRLTGLRRLIPGGGHA